MKKSIEHLIFSIKQYEMIQADETGQLIRRYYKDIEFTDRIPEHSPSPFTDAEVVYTGVIEESHIVYGNKAVVGGFPQKIVSLVDFTIYYDGNHFYSQNK